MDILAPTTNSVAERSSYIALARKWRSLQFEEIVGQESITRTLSNAISAQRVHHAYLFAGSRGIGKTSIARLFAKAIRCEARTLSQTPDQSLSAKSDTKSDIRSGLIRSCGHCSDCREIVAGNSVDVVEIDGASNNGVDAVRELRESARYLPSHGSKKIFIIDEAHMLTTAAFNALLKTLEEPPAHILFILATTEAHKIPATILSRCQRFDFRRVTPTQVNDRLSSILKSEGIGFDPPAIRLISNAADGSMRDALSLLDQVISFSDSKISVDSVVGALSVLPQSIIWNTMEAIVQADPQLALTPAEMAYQQGHDMKGLVRALLDFAHQAVLLSVGTDPTCHSALATLSTEELDKMRTLVAKRPLEDWELIFQLLLQGMENVAKSSQPKPSVDVLLVKTALSKLAVPAHSFAQSAAQGTGHSVGAAPPQSTASLTSSATSSASTGTGAAAQTNGQQQRPPVRQTSPLSQSPVTTPAEAHVESTASSSTQIKPASSAGASPQLVRPATPPAGSLSATSPSTAPSTPPPADKPASWEGLLEFVRSSRPLLASFLEHGQCGSTPTAGATELEVLFRHDQENYKLQIQNRVYSEQIQTLATQYFGFPVRVVVSLGAADGETVAARRQRLEAERIRSKRETALNHPLMKEAKSLFGAEVEKLEITDTPSEPGRP